MTSHLRQDRGQPLDRFCVHRLDRVVQDQETERVAVDQCTRQTDRQCKRLELPLAQQSRCARVVLHSVHPHIDLDTATYTPADEAHSPQVDVSFLA